MRRRQRGVVEDGTKGPRDGGTADQNRDRDGAAGSQNRDRERAAEESGLLRP